MVVLKHKKGEIIMHEEEGKGVLNVRKKVHARGARGTRDTRHEGGEARERALKDRLFLTNF